MKMLSPHQLRERLDERFRVLTGGSRDVLPRQQTLRALIDWSYDLLDMRERALFRRLGIFVNGFTLEAAVAVGSGEYLDELDVFDVLASLVDKSLVVAEPHDDALRYRLLESTRAYAVEKLADAGETKRVARRHLRYLRDRFTELREQRDRTTRPDDLEAALETEIEDVRSALDGALTRGDVMDGGELLAKTGTCWDAIGLEPEGLARCEAYLAALPADQPGLRAWLLTIMSYLAGAAGNKVRGFELAMHAVEQARTSGDASALAWGLHQLVTMAVYLHRFDEAKAALTEAEAIPGTSAHLRIRLLEARAHFSAGRGDLETAATVYEQLRKEERLLGFARGEQNAALNLAEVEYERGQTQRAIAIVRETLPTARSGADKNVRALLLDNLAGYLVAVDDLAGATAAACESIGIHAEREPDHAHVVIAIEHLALAFALRGDLARAAKLEGYAHAALERLGFLREFAEAKTYDRLTALLREGIAPEELALLTAEGAALTPEAAIALALEEQT